MIIYIYTESHYIIIIKERRDSMAVSKAKIRANNKYDKRAYDRVTILVHKGQKILLQDIATSRSQSLNKYIKDCINYYNYKHSIECPEID